MVKTVRSDICTYKRSKYWEIKVAMHVITLSVNIIYTTSNFPDQLWTLYAIVQYSLGVRHVNWCQNSIFLNSNGKPKNIRGSRHKHITCLFFENAVFLLSYLWMNVDSKAEFPDCMLEWPMQLRWRNSRSWRSKNVF